MHEYKLRGVSVVFPYQAYDCQLEYMTRVIQALQEKTNALLESPTGTGKTLCLLCATLAWRASLEQASEDEQPSGEAVAGGEVEIHTKKHKTWAESMKEAAATLAKESLPTIIYASRTHSQLAQVMGELRNTIYRPRTTVLGSRQQLCLEPEVAKVPGAAGNHMCRAKVAARSCSWYNRVEPFLRKDPDKNYEPLDIEQLVKLGRAQGPCPFYMAREMAKSADLIFMPYNYLIDSRTRAGLNMLSLENAVLIFDEAHNVEGVCSDSGSFDITAPFLGACIEEAGGAYAVAVKRQETVGGPVQEGDFNYFELATELRIVREMLKALEGAIAAVGCGDSGFTRPGLFMFELLKSMQVKTESDLRRIILKLEVASQLLMDDAAETGLRLRGAGQKLSTLVDYFRLLADSLESVEPDQPPPAAFYRVHIRLEKGRAGAATPTLHYWCFMPGLAMRALSRHKIRSFLLTSGTLSPLDSFAAELELDFPITLENPHVIEPSQVWIGVVGVGPLGAKLSSSYANRSSQRYKEDLGLALVNFARIVPGGVLVFFPSYGALQSSIDAWKGSLQGSGASASTTWERICGYKQPVIEPRESALFGQAAEDFNKKLDDPSTSGAIFFAVCRGKVSEGLDFSDRAGRAVIITGIPFANVTDAKVRLKKEVLDEAASRSSAAAKRARGQAATAMALRGDQWYTQQALRAVNQGMGRVIRHRNDYGAIILCDDRFASPRNQGQLSAWLRPLVKVHPNFGSASGSLTRFFKEQQTVAEFVPKKVLKDKAGNPLGMGFIAAAQQQQDPAPPRPPPLGLKEVPSALDVSGLARLIRNSIPASRTVSAPKQPGLLAALKDSSEHEQNAGAEKAAAGKGKAMPQSLAFDLEASLDTGKPLSRLQQLHGQPERMDALRQQAGARLIVSSSNAATRATGVLQEPQQAREHSGQQDLPAAAQREHGSTINLRHPAKHMLRGVNSATGQSKDGHKKEKGDSTAYFSRLKQELPSSAFQKINDSLKAYKQRTVDSRQLYDTVLSTLCVPGRRHLLNGFLPFVRQADTLWFKNCIRVLIEEGSQPSSSEPDVASHSRKTTAPAAKAAPPATAGPLEASNRQEGEGALSSAHRRASSSLPSQVQKISSQTKCTTGESAMAKGELQASKSTRPASTAKFDRLSNPRPPPDKSR